MPLIKWICLTANTLLCQIIWVHHNIHNINKPHQRVKCIHKINPLNRHNSSTIWVKINIGNRRAVLAKALTRSKPVGHAKPTAQCYIFFSHILWLHTTLFTYPLSFSLFLILHLSLPPVFEQWRLFSPVLLLFLLPLSSPIVYIPCHSHICTGYLNGRHITLSPPSPYKLSLIPVLLFLSLLHVSSIICPVYSGKWRPQFQNCLANFFFSKTATCYLFLKSCHKWRRPHRNKILCGEFIDWMPRASARLRGQ